MQIMETTKEGSYAAMLRDKEKKENAIVNGDDNDGGNEHKGGDEEKMDVAPLGNAASNPGGGKVVNGKTKKSHAFSKSVSGMFGKHKKQESDRYSGHQKAHTEAMNQANLAISKANERGQKLQELGDKSEQMRDNARNFNDLAKQLANKKW